MSTARDRDRAFALRGVARGISLRDPEENLGKFSPWRGIRVVSPSERAKDKRKEAANRYTNDGFAPISPPAGRRPG